jgi:signal transduction histidine kinase
VSRARALWDAPAAVPGPPRRVWRDWVLVGVVAALALVEASLRPEVRFGGLWALVLVAVSATLLWRRTRPLTMFAIAFTAGTVTSLVLGRDPQLFTTVYFLILVYSVFRWGSGRAMIVGGSLVIAGTLLTFLSSTPTLGDVIGGIAVAVTTSTLGIALRWRSRARARELDQVRLVEREQLARDLHDTVAHHVSAIAIQAQAGSAVAGTDPDATAEVLRAIEGEASRTLREMRSMVGILRTTEASELAPTPGIAALTELAGTDAGGPAVNVRLEGDLDSVPPAVAAAVFRLGQEAVTNARRHARHATGIDLTVVVDAGGVRVTVRDDGEAAASGSGGYGIRGMRERALLLGGTLHAGPAPGGGWLVAAQLPRSGWTA